MAPSLGITTPARVFALLLVLRLINALALRTFFQPDEYFQALEPAWQMAFGPHSGAWITWEWHHRLRSSLHPALFALAYGGADRLGALAPALRPAALLLAPRLLQAVFAAGSDWGTWRLGCAIYGADTPAAAAALALTVLSPWQWYCSTRTFSNSLETTLTALALSLWPWALFTPAPADKENANPPAVAHFVRGRWRALASLRISLGLAALAVVLRPTNVLVWFPVAGLTLFRGVGRSAPAVSALVIVQAVLCGTAVLIIAAAADRLYYGLWTFPPYQWLQFNLAQSLAVFYGRANWHYYLSQALPLLTIACLPFAAIGLFRPMGGSEGQARSLRALATAVYVTVAVLSVIVHKEVRFVYPLLPILHVLAAPHAAAFFTETPRALLFRRHLSLPLKLRHTGYLLNAISLNVLVAIFLSVLHQGAPLAVLAFLRTRYADLHPSLSSASPAALGLEISAAPSATPPFVLFLTPCHSTPWRSHLLWPGLGARALTCEPPLHTAPGSAEREQYRDEADRFYDDPAGFMRRELWPEGREGGVGVASYIVGFEGIEPWLDEFFRSDHSRGLGVSLGRAWEGWNGFFNEDSRRSGKLVVWATAVEAT